MFVVCIILCVEPRARAATRDTVAKTPSDTPTKAEVVAVDDEEELIKGVRWE